MIPFKQISHGTEWGAGQHRMLGQQPCPDCARAEELSRRARRIRKGLQDVKVPAAVLADLIESCSPDARAAAVEVLGEKIIEACQYRNALLSKETA